MICPHVNISGCQPASPWARAWTSNLQLTHHFFLGSLFCASHQYIELFFFSLQTVALLSAAWWNASQLILSTFLKSTNCFVSMQLLTGIVYPKVNLRSKSFFLVWKTKGDFFFNNALVVFLSQWDEFENWICLSELNLWTGSNVSLKNMTWICYFSKLSWMCQVEQMLKWKIISMLACTKIQYFNKLINHMGGSL